MTVAGQVCGFPQGQGQAAALKRNGRRAIASLAHRTTGSPSTRSRRSRRRECAALAGDLVWRQRSAAAAPLRARYRGPRPAAWQAKWGHPCRHRIGLVRRVGGEGSFTHTFSRWGTRLTEVVEGAQRTSPAAQRAARGRVLEPAMASKRLPCRCPANLRATAERNNAGYVQAFRRWAVLGSNQ
jgi:hypothetical protein